MKYIIYCRKSTDEDGKQILSIESQLQELKDYAKKENLEIGGIKKMQKNTIMKLKKLSNNIQTSSYMEKM